MLLFEIFCAGKVYASVAVTRACVFVCVKGGGWGVCMYESASDYTRVHGLSESLERIKNNLETVVVCKEFFFIKYD